MILRELRHAVVTVVATMAVLLGFSATALAQDYTVTATSGQWATPPANASDFGLVGDDANKLMDRSNGFPAFDISYFGANYTSMRVCTNGYVQFGSQSTTSYSITSGPLSGATDGLCFPAWGDNYGYAGSLTPKILTWTDGTAPYRRFVIAWTNWSRCCSYNGSINYQIQFYETTGRIQFAYTGTWTASATYYVGIDEPAGAGRFVRPAGGETSGYYAISTNPTSDWRFDPKETRFTGNVFLDAIVSDSNGYGRAVQSGVPAAGLGVQLRDTSNSVLATAAVGTDGSYTLTGLALDSSKTGSVYVSTSNYIANVSATVGGNPYAALIASSLKFGANTAVGDYTFNDTTDPGGVFRAPAGVCAAIGRAYGWVTSRTVKPIPTVNVIYDTVSSETSKYVPGASIAGSYLRIGGPSSANPDAYDPGAVMRVYARHVVRAMTGAFSTSSTIALDTTTDGTNALADGMGVYLHAIVDGATKLYDGISASQTNTFDYESPSLSVPKSPNSGGWFGAAMYDFVDGANESHDTIDGTIAAGLGANRPFTVFDGLTTFSLLGFVYDWDNRGFGGSDAARNFIYHGLLSDDSGESDDTKDLATDLGVAGQLRRNRTLNPFNDDWYRIQVPKATNVFTVDMVFARPAVDPQMSLTLTTAAGAVVATGAWDDDAGVYRARTGAIPAGTLFIQISHQSGSYVGNYDLQASSPLVGTTDGPYAWTLNRPLIVPIGIDGGVGPYQFAVKKPTLLPLGLSLDAPNGRVAGTPAAVGDTLYTLDITDSGSPVTTYTMNIPLRVNGELKFTSPALNGIASGKTTDLNLGRSGGTAPFVVSDLTGSLPAGLSLTPDFHVTGVTNATGGGDIAFKVTDAAGASYDFATTLVACAKHTGSKLAVEVGAGASASGFYFDAIQGTIVNVGLTTAKRHAVREFDAFIVGPDGKVVEGGKLKIGKGKASLRGVPILLSGRYFVVVGGKDAGEATQLFATFSSALPKRLTGEQTLDFGDEVEFTFGAIDGATATLSCRTTLRMAMRIIEATRPDGTNLAYNDIQVTESEGKATFVLPIDQSGTWTIRMTHRPGPVGDLTYSMSVKFPKGAEYSAD